MKVGDRYRLKDLKDNAGKIVRIDSSTEIEILTVHVDFAIVQRYTMSRGEKIKLL